MFDTSFCFVLFFWQSGETAGRGEAVAGGGGSSAGEWLMEQRFFIMIIVNW